MGQGVMCEYSSYSGGTALICKITDNVCGFQRYCIERDKFINTYGHKTCVIKNNITNKDENN